MAALVLTAACLVQTPASAQQATLLRPQPKPPADIPVLSERADKGDRCAMMALGVAYETGDGVAPDFAAANRWYLMAIKQREPVSMLRYSTNLRFGRGVEKDENAATRLFNDAAKATVEAVRSPQGLCR